MSYQQTYHASVPYSGTVSVSYPKSDSGGSTTAHYSGEVPLSVTINVNTAPFEGSVHGCNNSIDLLTGSVVAMNAAQCAAIEQTAKDVSKSLIDGFFGTINTELTQQLQALDSAVKAGLGLIFEQGKAADAQKQTLETDYNRISSRYAALFNNLDTECYKRIYALDRQAFALAEKVKQPLLDAQRHNAAFAVLGIEEGAGVQSFLFASNLNKKTQRVLRSLYEYITQESRLTSLVSSFLNNEQLPEKTDVYIPVLYMESDALETEKTACAKVDENCFVYELPDEGGAVQQCFENQQYGADMQKNIKKKTQDFCRQSEWEKTNTEEYMRVKKEFDSIAEAYFSAHDDEVNRRVYAAMLSLRDNNEILDIKGKNS
jgi:hypothetical protein